MSQRVFCLVVVTHARLRCGRRFVSTLGTLDVIGTAECRSELSVTPPFRVSTGTLREQYRPSDLTGPE